MWSGCVGRTLLKDVVWLCWKDIADGCGLVVLEGHCRRMWSGCVGRTLLTDVVWLCWKDIAEGCGLVVLEGHC